MTPEQQAELTDTTARYLAGVETLKASTEASVQSVWAASPDWYDAAVIAALSAEAASASLAGQQAITGAAEEFATATVSILTDTARAAIPRVDIPPVRNGAPLTLVHSRTAERFKRAFSQGASSDEAYLQALKRAGGLARTDMTLRQRAAQIVLLDELGVKKYRRVVQPELSETGSCGLCVAAADRVYGTDMLMPIHPPSCNCIVMPIIGSLDPGKTMNKEDLDRIYADAGGSTRKQDLVNTRYKVNEHGEYGLVLSRAKDDFRGPSQLALEDDPARAARMLTQALPVLDRLEAAGGPQGPLSYQRELVARLRRIVGTPQASAA